MSTDRTTPTTISPKSLRDHAENIGHSSRGIYPVGPLLDAADAIERLRAALFRKVREDSHCAASGEPPCPEGQACGCRLEMEAEIAGK